MGQAAPATQPVEETQPAETQPAAARQSAEGPPGTSAETAGPVEVRVGAPRGPVVKLRSLAAELGFEASYDERSSTVFTYETGWPWVKEGRYHQVNRARRFEETIGLHADGVLVDERYAKFDLMGRWGLCQEWYNEVRPGADETHSPHGDLLEYDLHLGFLPRGKLSGDVFAQRLDSRIPRQFLPSLDRTRERYGVGLFLNDATLPMRVTYEHVDDELTSRSGTLRDDEKRGEDTFRYELTWQLNPAQAFRLEYEYNDRAEQYSGTATRYDTNRNYLILGHTWRFGPEGRSSWETLARLQDERGDLARDQYELSSRLRLQHTDRIATNWAAQWLRDGFQELETETWRGEAGLTHQIGEVLTTTGQAYGFQQDTDENADLCEWGTLLSSAFAKDNRLGRFSANLSYNHAQTTASDGERRGIVIGESVTFKDPLAPYLQQRDIDLFSIVVTDANRSRTYLPVRDYVAWRTGRYTVIRRVATGAIADRETVLVAYTYKVADDYAIGRDRIDLRIQQTFTGGLVPYYAGSVQDERIASAHRLIAGATGLRDRDVSRHRLGATFRRPRWSVGLEYEYNDDSIDPYHALHANGDAVLWQRAAHVLDAKATLSRFWFWGAEELAPRGTTLLDLGLGYRYLLGEQFEANAAAAYRFEDDSLFGQTHGVDLTTALDWRLGLFTLRFEVEYDLLSLPDSRDNTFAFWLKLKRAIPVLAAAENRS